MEYKEIWHYKQDGGKIFRDFILNIAKRKIECSGFPADCNTPEAKQKYVDTLKEQCSINIKVEDIRKDPASRYSNKIMANSMWGKWAQNPGSQSSIYMCDTLHDYHDKLLTGHVKHVSLVSDKLLQVEAKNDRNIDGENHENQNSRSGLGGRNTIVGAFVTAAARDLTSHIIFQSWNPISCCTLTQTVLLFMKI